jgi:hypothetical protein
MGSGRIQRYLWRYLCMVLISVYAVPTKVKRRVRTRIKQPVYWLGYGLDTREFSVRFSTWTRELGPFLLQIAENGYGKAPDMYSIANNGSFHRYQNGTIHHHLEPRVSISGITPPLPHTLILHFWPGGGGYVPRPRSEKLANNRRTPKNNVLIYF